MVAIILILPLAAVQLRFQLCFQLFNNFVDVGPKRVDAFYGLRHLAVKLYNIYHLAHVFGLHIRTNRQVIIVLGNGCMVYRGSHILHIGLCSKDVYNAVDMLGQQHIVVGFFLIKGFATGIDKLRAGVGLMFRQHQDVNGNASAIKQVGRKGDNRFHKVVVHQILPYFLLGTATIKHTGETHNDSTTTSRKVAKSMQHKSKVGLRLGRQHASRGKTCIVDKRGVARTHPSHRIRRVRNNSIERLIVAVLGI